MSNVKNRNIKSVLLSFLMMFSFLFKNNYSFAIDNSIDSTTTVGSEIISGDYTVTENTSIIASTPGQSGLVIAEGAVVTINIPYDVTLTVKGANAQGTIGAGAGIKVPENAILTIKGNGKLVVNGGNAANGENGGDGTNGTARQGGDDDETYAGEGGNGGSGGGGAGAGIGGTGGNGGAGGSGGDLGEHSGDMKNGIKGSNGQNGTNGSNCGTVRIEKTVETSIKGGMSGKQGEDGQFGIYDFFNARQTGKDYSFGGAGGPGGGGNGGSAASNIGGGGGGGAGAGAGGSGAYMCNDSQFNSNNLLFSLDTYVDSNNGKHVNFLPVIDPETGKYAPGNGGGYVNHQKVSPVTLNWRNGSSSTLKAITGGEAGDYGNNGNYGLLGSIENLSVELNSSMVEEIPPQEYAAGNTIQPNLIIKDRNAPLIKGRDYTVNWVNNVNSGTATAKVTGIGNYRGTIDVNFTITSKTLTNDMVDGIRDQEYTGEEIKPEINIKNENIELRKDIDYTITYNNNINIGEATAELSGIGNYRGTVTKAFNIVHTIIKKMLSNDMVDGIRDQEYTGEEIEPEITIKENDITLNEGIDYTLEYTNNINLGDANIKITGIGDYYEGTINKGFKIVPKLLIDDMVDNIPSKTYTGTSIEPEIIVQDDNIVLNKGTDYTLEYTNNINAGVANVKITGLGNYTGTIIKKFNINGEASGDNQDIDTSDWGTLTINNEIKNWVNSNGTTSAIVEEGKTWLKERSIDHYDENGRPVYTSAWYGIENPLKDDGTYVFEPGSRFWVRWVNNEDSDWDTYYDQLDDKYKNDIDSGRLWIFLIGVTDPNGYEYKEFGTTAPLYIQLGDDWDKNDLRAVFISKGIDEFFDKDRVSYVNFDESSESPMVGEFAKVNLSHFSLYGLYDSRGNNNETDNTVEPNDNDKNNNDNKEINKDDQNQSETIEKSSNDLDNNELGINSFDENLYDWNTYPIYQEKTVNSDPFQYKNTGNILPDNFCNIILLSYCLYWLKKRKF